MAWSLQQKLKDAQEGLNKASEDLTKSLDGGDSSPAQMGGMVDPTRVSHNHFKGSQAAMCS